MRRNPIDPGGSRAAAPPRRPKRWPAQRAAVGGLALGAASGANILNIGAVPDLVAGSYGVSLATVGLFTTVLLVMHTASQIPGGRAIDRFGARRAGLFALLVAALCSAAAAFTPDPTLLLGARTILGVGTGVAFVAGLDYVRAMGGSALVQGLFGGFSMGGGALALVAVPQLEPSLGWRAPFVFGVSTAVLAGLLLALGPRDAARRAGAGRSQTTALSLVSDRRLYRLALLHTATFGLGLLVANWVVALLVRLDHSPSAAGAIGALTVGLTMVSRPLGGWLVKNRPDWTRRAVVVSLVAAALGCAGLVAAESTLVAILCATAVGIGAGISFAPVFTGAVRIRPDAPGAAIGVVNMWGTFAVLVATPLLGLAFSLPGEGRIGFLVVAALAAAALLALPRTEDLGLEPAGRRERESNRP